MSRSWRIVPISELDPTEVLSVINDAFGFERPLEWYRWKHLECPWGASIGVAAIDDSGPIGVRLLLPWRFRIGASDVVAHRATEAATVRRAQGLGVFTELNRWMMEELPTAMLFSTPNRHSRSGYLKLGWKVMARIPHVWESRARVRHPGVRDLDPDPKTPATAWDRRSLAWRADPRSGWRYQLREGSTNGSVAHLYFRRLRIRGIPIAAPMASLPVAAPEALWHGMLRDAHAWATLRPATQPAPPDRPLVRLRRGESLFVGWTPPNSPLPAADAPIWHAAPWMGADLEGAI